MPELQLDIPDAVQQAMNAPDRGPWTYFNQYRPVADGPIQQYAVEAPKDVAEELLNEYLRETVDDAEKIPNFDDVKTEAELSASHVYGEAHNIHLNIFQTDGDNQRLRVLMNDE